MLHGRRTKRIGRTDERRPALALQEIRKLADGRRLPRPVHADDQRHRGGARSAPAGRSSANIGRISRLDEIPKPLAGRGPCLDRGHDPCGRGDADVRGDQQFLESLERVDVDRMGASGVICLADDVLEAPDDLLLGTGEAVAKATENDTFESLVSGGRIRQPGRRQSGARRSGTAHRLCLGPLPPDHQRIERRPDVRAPGEHLRHLRRNRQLDAVARAKRQGGTGRANALGDHLHPRKDLAERPPLGQLDADVTISAQFARARQDEIAQAAQAGQRLAPTARGASPAASPRPGRA